MELIRKSRDLNCTWSPFWRLYKIVPMCHINTAESCIQILLCLFSSSARTRADGTTRLIKITPQIHVLFLFCIVLPFRLNSFCLFVFKHYFIFFKQHTSALLIRINILHAHYADKDLQKETAMQFSVSGLQRTLGCKSELRQSWFCCSCAL